MEHTRELGIMLRTDFLISLRKWMKESPPDNAGKRNSNADNNINSKKRKFDETTELVNPEFSLDKKLKNNLL